jgi:hypothetical protein
VLAMAASLVLLAPLAAEEDSSDLFKDIPAPSTEAPAPSVAAPEASTGGLKISGEEEAVVPIPADPVNWNYRSEARAPAFRNLLGLEYRLGDLKLVSEWHADMSGFSATSPGTDPWTALLRIRPGENYVGWSPGAFRFALGYQIFSWGSADGVNPTDTINPRDYSVGVQSTKIPILAVAASWYPAPVFSVDAVYAPREQGDIFPVDPAEQIPDVVFYGYDLKLSAAQIAELGAAIMANPAQQQAIVAQYLAANAASIKQVPVTFNRSVTENQPEDDLSAFLAGARLNFHAAAFDASVSYLYDYDPFYTPSITTAGYTVNETGMPLGPLGTIYRISSISLDRQRIHRLGLDLKGSAGPVGLWLESAWSQSHDWKVGSYTARSPGLASVVGCDVSWGPTNAFYSNLQAVVQWYPWFDKTFGTDYPDGVPSSDRLGDPDYMTEYYYRAFTQRLGGQTEGLNVGASLALKFPFAGNVVTPTLSAAYLVPFEYDDSSVTRYGSLVLNPEVDIMPVDSWHLILGARLQYAWVKDNSEGTVSLDRTTDNVGIYTPDNQVYVMARYLWNESTSK